MFTPNDSKVVDEILRVLKPGGQANVLLHNRFSWYAFLAKVSGMKLIHEAQDPPLNRLYSVWQARKIFSRFSFQEIFFDRFPSTTNRRGTLPTLYNQVFLRLARIFPTTLIRPMGFYIIIRAIK